MSSHSEPYANGFGILAGVLILWIGTLAIVFAVKTILTGSDGSAEDVEDEESRAGVQGIDIAAIQSREIYRSFTSSYAISESDLPGFAKI